MASFLSAGSQQTYRVAAHGLRDNVRAFAASAQAYGAVALNLTNADGSSLATVSFEYSGTTPPELFESLAADARVVLTECGSRTPAPPAAKG